MIKQIAILIFVLMHMVEHGELRFKIVRIETAGQEVSARLSNVIVRACGIRCFRVALAT